MLLRSNELGRIGRRILGPVPPSKVRAVLGLNAYSHDAGAALVVDGRLVFAAEEERYDRVRHSAAFPHGAIAAALR
ncbi:MAG: carbamoyltransferase N-terminal domain-containing protein, partial [Planctomycetota bacterium]